MDVTRAFSSGTIGVGLTPKASSPGRSSWVRSIQATGKRDPVLVGAVAALERAIQAKDPYTMGHSARVRRLAVAMARQFGLAEALVQEIALAAELHDIGKIGVPDELLHKAGPLSAEERRRVLEHAVIGERILAPLLSDRPVVLAVARWHHERTDGSGYPDGLRGEQIPLAARIVAVADAFDAMTSTRPYRPAFSARAAVRELWRCASTQFDPRCIRALLGIFRCPATASTRVWGGTRSRGIRTAPHSLDSSASARPAGPRAHRNERGPPHRWATLRPGAPSRIDRSLISPAYLRWFAKAHLPRPRLTADGVAGVL